MAAKQHQVALNIPLKMLTVQLPNKATVTITVTPVNDDPVANNDSDTTTEGGSVTMDIASNDTDAEGAVVKSTITIH